MKQHFYLILAICLFLFSPSKAQELIQMEDGEQNFYIGGFSTAILPQGIAEINWNNTLISHWVGLKSSPLDGVFHDRLRQSNFFSTLDGYYGFTNKGNWNLGLRLQFSSARLDNMARSSPFKVFAFQNGKQNTRFDKTYAELTGYGLRFRAIPIEALPNLLVNVGYTATTSRSDEYRENLNTDRNIFDASATYLLELNTNSYYYFSFNNVVYPGSGNNSEWLFNSGGSFFLVHLFFLQNLAVYPGLSYNVTYKSPDVLDQFLIKTREQVDATIGVQYQPSPLWSFNFSISRPLLIKTSNLVSEIVRESYSAVNIGARVVLR